MGKFTDKFMNAFNGGNDDDYDEYDEDFYEDDYADDEEEPEEKPSLFKRKAAAEEREVKETREKEAAPAKTSNASPFNRAAKPASRSNSGRSAAAGNEVCIFKPSSIEDSREITETLLQGKAVVINFEGLHVEISQRIIDFISGSCYALDGNLQKISNYIFIATPNSVDISGDFQDLFGGEEQSSFDIAGFKSPLI